MKKVQWYTIILLLLNCFLILSKQFKVSNADVNTHSAYTPESMITVSMFELFQGGQSRNITCQSNSKKWGCTAFCDNLDGQGNLWPECKPQGVIITPVPYPTNYGNPVTVDIEKEYLPNIIAQELVIDVAHPLAIQAQAIAARP